MTNGSQSQPNDLSSKFTHFLQASGGHLKLPIQYGTSEKISGSKSPKGCYLSGEHVVYYVDDWLPVQVHSELALFPSKFFQNEDKPLKIGTQISANEQYIGYCIQPGTICIYNRQTRQQCHLQGHQQIVTDMAFCGDQVDLLASASSDGHVFIWSISETVGKEDERIIRGQISFSIQVLGEWESVHPLVCWCNQDLVVGIDKYVLALTPEDLKKNFGSSSFTVDKPIKCHVGDLIRRIRFAGLHDLEVTALTVISRCPTLIASASKDGSVRIWRDQDPVPVTGFAPYEGLPVHSLSCLSPFESDLHVILTSGGPENRELKLWVPLNTACLVPTAANGKWKCIETLELKHSIDRRAWQLYFSQTLQGSETSFIVMGSMQDNSIYVVHVESEAPSTYMDYLSKFCVELPISNLTARSNSSSDGEGIVEIFCVHEESIQLYKLYMSQCMPPEHNGSLGDLSPTGSCGKSQELNLSDPSGFCYGESDNYCTQELDEKSEALSPVSKASKSVSGPSTSAGFGSWIEVPGFLDQLKDARSSQTADFTSQQRKSTGLQQINSMEGNLVSQHETVSDLSSKDTWKGAKYSPLDSFGKLTETMAVTKFATCTVPSLSLEQKSYEMLSSNEWDVNACRSTDPKGFSHGHSYVLNESPIVDSTTVYARGSVLSSVTDQKVIGKANTILSSGFIDKKTVLVKTHKLQETGQTSDFDNLSIPSDMLSLENTVTSQQARDKTVCSKTFTNTTMIEFPESSDWKYVLGSSTPLNFSLPCVLDKYDGKLDPNQMRGMENSKNTEVGDSLLLGTQNRKLLNPFETFDECASSVQASLGTLASMHTEFQKHISNAVEGSMSEESTRLELCIVKRLEMCLETYPDETHVGFEETGTRVRELNLQHIALAILNKDFPSSVCENVCREISSLAPAIARAILSDSDRVETAVVRNMTQEQEIITEQLEKSIACAIGEQIIRQLQVNFSSQKLQEYIEPCFQDKALPLFENLFKTVIERGEPPIQDKEHGCASYKQGNLTNYLIVLASTLQEILAFASMDLRSMEEELREGQQRLLNLMHGDASYVIEKLGTDRDVRKVNDDHDRTICTGYISRLVGEGKLEEAFERTLSLGDINIVWWLCNQVDPSKLFASIPLPLSQFVLLFLMQQLTCDLGREAAQKLSWIQEAAASINPHDPMVSYYIRPVLEQVYINLQREVMKINPGSTLVNKIRVIMHVINSLLVSCQ